MKVSLWSLESAMGQMKTRSTPKSTRGALPYMMSDSISPGPNATLVAVAVGDGRRRSRAEGAGRDLDAGGRLAALVLVTVDEVDHAPDDGFVEAVGDDLVDAAVVLDVGLDDGSRMS